MKGWDGDSLVSAKTEIAFTFGPAPNALTTFELLSFFCSYWQKAGARLKLTETEKQQLINYLYKSAKDLVVEMLIMHSFDFQRNMFFWKAYKTRKCIYLALSLQIDMALKKWRKEKKLKPSS